MEDDDEKSHLTNLPTIMSSTSEAFFLILLQMSMVKSVLLELKMEVREEMRADIMTASIRPRRPSGMRRSTSVGNAMLEQLSWPQFSWQTAGSAQPT